MMILKKVSLSLCLFWFSFSAFGASFDCSKAQTTVEKLICSDQALSSLDEDLRTSYSEMQLNLTPNKAKSLVSAQRKWIKDVRNKCADVECLSNAYTARIKQIGPFSDDKISCAEMRKFPNQIFNQGIDLGSGYGSPVEVDFDCPESVSSLPFMKKLLTLAETIRADGSSLCSGSIVYALSRYYEFNLTTAGFAPETFQSDVSAKAVPEQQTSAYFRQWSEESQYNFDLYQEFSRTLDSDVEMLANHYQKSNKLTAQRARVIAGSVLQLVLDRAAGAFPSRDFEADSAFVERARNKNATIAEIQKLLADVATPVPKKEIYKGLKAALLAGRPFPLIRVIVSALSKADLETLGAQGEPLLSLALKDQEVMSLLLAAGVAVDAANDFGKTALFYAIGSNDQSAAKYLLEHKASANHSYKSASELRPKTNGYVDECIYQELRHTRRTPLMHAAQNADVGMLTLLLAGGAKVEAVDDMGFNALDYAVLGKRSDNQKFLISKGMKPNPAKTEN